MNFRPIKPKPCDGMLESTCPFQASVLAYDDDGSFVGRFCHGCASLLRVVAA